MSIKAWKISAVDKDRALEIAKEWDIPFFLAVLLSVRGLENKEDAYKFLYGYNDYCNPFDFADMDRLCERTRQAIDNSERICIYGDYDADGVTATALVYSYLKSKGADVVYYIPKRDSDGYGLNVAAIDKFKEQGVKVIFTVDNGISAYNEVEYANSIGIDSIITDHHRPPDILPNAKAVVDPYRKDCLSKCKYFSGVGVAFKAIQALEHGKTDIKDLIAKYSDLVTIGTMGDFIELKEETRDLVREGINVIAQAKRPGLRIILDKIGLLGRKLDTSNISFGIVPRINVSGRVGDADQSVKLLLADNGREAYEAFKDIEEKNECRREAENEIYDCIEQQLRDEPERKYQKIVIVEGEKWHHGVLGIVASKMVKRYGKPCVLITYDGEDAKGSCRSVDNFSIHEAISACSVHLDRFGGHPMAAGINLKTKNIGQFKKALLEYAESFENMPFMEIKLDCKLNPAALSPTMMDHLEKLKPFGSGNPEPIFGVYSMEICDIKDIAGGTHLKLYLSRGSSRIEVLYFRKNSSSFLYKKGEIVDVALTLHQNKFEQFPCLSLFVSDVKLSGSDGESTLRDIRVYEKFKLGKSLSDDEVEKLLPTREEVTEVYSYLKFVQGRRQRADIISRRINNPGINTAKVCVILDVLKELGIVEIDERGSEFDVIVNETEDKTELTLSETLSSLCSMRGNVQSDVVKV